MSIPQFNQTEEPLLYELSTLPEAGLTGYWAGYFAGPGSNLGTSAGTTTVWQDLGGGFYLFLDKEPADLVKFSCELLTLRPSLGPVNVVRFLWISNADKSYLRWQMITGFASVAGSGPDISWTLTRAVVFSIGAYQLLLSGLSTITCIPDANGGGIQFPGGGSFSGPEGGYTFTVAGISFSGASLGAFNSVINATPPHDTSQPGLWDALHIGLLYGAAPAKENTGADVQAADAQPPSAGVTEMLFMPVFNGQQSSVSLNLSFDPLYPLVASRTALSMFPLGGNPSLILETYVRTTKGYPVQLTPLAASGAIPDARFVLGYCPVEGDAPENGLRYHLSPDGAFQITVKLPDSIVTAAGGTGINNQLLLGLSGLEYVSLGTAGYMMVFEGGRPAYIPALDTDKSVAPDISAALTGDATTSHLTVLSVNSTGTGPVYFAQPQQAPLFSNRNQRQDGVLDFNPVPACTLAYTGDQRPPVFPSGIYAGLPGEEASLAARIENASLAPYRSFCIGNTYGIQTPGNEPVRIPQPDPPAGDVPLAVTPQGLVVALATDYTDYEGLILGNMPGTAYEQVELTAIQGKFRQVLQSNQLFFVAANVDELMTGTSIRYMLTEAEEPILLDKLNVPQTVIDAVYLTLNGVSQPFATEAAFVACIGVAAGIHLPAFLNVAGILKVEMDDWVFQLSPRSWRTDVASPTILIGKFCNRTLMDLVNDSSSWLWPEVATPATGSLADMQALLTNMFKAASMSEATADLKLFYDTVVNDLSWNGFLFLNAPVEISEMPDELKFLRAGINPEQFYTHHIGFSQTPFHIDNGQPKLEQTAVFGLIDYEDAADLYAEETIPFGFKTMQLQVRFANAAMVSFSTEVELMLNQLLGSVLSKQVAVRGNNLIITGSYQRVGGAPGYSFTLTGENVFFANNGALTSIEVLSVQLVNGSNNPDPSEVLITFTLSGNLRFVYVEAFDLFSYGPADNSPDSYLRYTGLSIDMQFSIDTPAIQTFTVQEAGTAFDMTASIPRPSSLVSNFPLTVSALVASPDLSAGGEAPAGQTPEDMGYTSVAAPLDQTPMKPSWYGLAYTLDLGTFGALTGNAGFKISILAAWSQGPNQSTIPIYLGLKLPGIAALAGSFPLQGVLRIGFRNFQFETYTTNDKKLGYLLRLRNFSLSALVWSFPPGNSDIVLFGQPGNPKGSIGWYAAYDSGFDEKENSLANPVQRRLLTGRRTPSVE